MRKPQPKKPAPKNRKNINVLALDGPSLPTLAAKPRQAKGVSRPDIGAYERRRAGPRVPNGGLAAVLSGNLVQAARAGLGNKNGTGPLTGFGSFPAKPFRKSGVLSPLDPITVNINGSAGRNNGRAKPFKPTFPPFVPLKFTGFTSL